MLLMRIVRILIKIPANVNSRYSPLGPKSARKELGYSHRANEDGPRRSGRMPLLRGRHSLRADLGSPCPLDWNDGK
jgi:hypothetical protein